MAGRCSSVKAGRMGSNVRVLGCRVGSGSSLLSPCSHLPGSPKQRAALDVWCKEGFLTDVPPHPQGPPAVPSEEKSLISFPLLKESSGGNQQSVRKGMTSSRSASISVGGSEEAQEARAGSGSVSPA